MGQGSLHFTSAEHDPMEIHVAEAIVASGGMSVSQGSLTLLGPKILQITAERGDLNVGAGVAGATAWGIYEALKSENAPISPSIP